VYRYSGAVATAPEYCFSPRKGVPILQPRPE
jgi:hypothetical protein